MRSAIAPKPEPVVIDLIDELGVLQEDLAKLRDKEERAKLLRGQIVEILKLKPGEAMNVEGRKYWARIGEQGFRRSITDMPKLFVLLTKKVFLEHCSFTLENLDNLLAEPVRIQVVEKQQIGPRKFETFGKTARAA